VSDVDLPAISRQLDVVGDVFHGGGLHHLNTHQKR
jgi:hypothetical protein